MNPEKASPENEGAMPEILHEPSRSIVEQLAKIAAGKDDPDNKIPTPEHLEWFAAKTKEFWLTDMPTPFLFPTENGNLSIEWYIGHREQSLDVDFATRTGTWEWWDSQSDEEHSETLNLEDRENWEKIQRASTGHRPLKPDGKTDGHKIEERKTPYHEQRRDERRHGTDPSHNNGPTQGDGRRTDGSERRTRH